MSTFAKFDTQAFLREEGWPPAKAAKVAKVLPSPLQTLASLATLAAAKPDSEYPGADGDSAGEESSGAPREWSEGVARLELMDPPSGFSTAQWAQLVADARGLLTHWGSQADRLGWTAYDLFGCHHTKPAARYDCMGLACLIDGRRIVAMTAGEAVINARLDHMVTYRRTPLKPEQNFLWQCT